ncbi:hypothetical protein HDR61_02045 [bacterium]|nr:hypothetical protein [bacterium]
MRKLLILLGFVGCLFCNSARAAEMVNVEYIHLLIEQKWGITVPYNPSVTNPKVAANMEYLLGMVDITNKRLNGTATTDYLHSEYATQYAADTVAANDAVSRLIVDWSPKFFVTTTSTTSSFSFKMSARGTFMIDWGDGTRDIIKRTDTSETTYSHTYSAAGARTIGIGGRAMEYNTKPAIAAISFWSNTNVAGISGALGAIFSTIGDGAQSGQQPRFYRTFSGCSNLSGSIPENLFAGISGAPASSMFCGTFSSCRGLTGPIPENLFAGISGAPASSMFYGTFSSCRGLTGPIPENLFAGISGKPEWYMFKETFSGCSGLTGSIPEKLFARISGAPAMGMFHKTFSGCSNLSGSIPGNLFAGISGAPASSMFYGTFYECSGLTGPIPENLFAGISGAPAEDMFVYTFYKCSGLTSIPENLFGNISGAAQRSMFFCMFCNGTSLTGPSAKINGKYLYKIWPSATSVQVGGCYLGDTGLDDYADIPAAWK